MIAAALVCVLVIVLAGCADPPRAATALPDEAACRDAALADPAVRGLMERGAGSLEYAASHQRDLAAARADATLACLRARGTLPPGGVEPRKTDWYPS